MEKVGQEKSLEIKLVAGSGGIFDVYADKKLIYSKSKTGVYPKVKEIIKLL